MRRTTWTAAVAAGLLALTACGGGQGAGPQQAESADFTGEYDGPDVTLSYCCLLYTSPSPRDLSTSRMPSSA